MGGGLGILNSEFRIGPNRFAGRPVQMRMLSFVSDARYAVRLLITRPGFSAVAILTLALGIGATTAIFTVVNAVLLSPLPFRDADRLAEVRIVGRGGEIYPLPDADLLARRDQNQTSYPIALCYTGAAPRAGRWAGGTIRGRRGRE